MSTDSAFPGKGEKTQTAFYCTTTPPHQHALRQVGRLKVLARYLGPLHLGWTEEVEWRRLRLRVTASLVLLGACVIILGNQCTVLGFHQGEPRGHTPTIQNRRRETSTCLLQTTWGCRILTLHLNYVAGEQRNFSKLFVLNMTSVSRNQGCDFP